MPLDTRKNGHIRGTRKSERGGNMSIEPFTAWEVAIVVLAAVAFLWWFSLVSNYYSLRSKKRKKKKKRG